jgi:hypothetical protein
MHWPYSLLHSMCLFTHEHSHCSMCVKAYTVSAEQIYFSLVISLVPQKLEMLFFCCSGKSNCFVMFVIVYTEHFSL